MKNLNLTGQFLIAMPSMTDPVFSETITYICTHNEDGAVGIIINKLSELDSANLFSQLALTPQDRSVLNLPVFSGGPVQPERGFVLHTPSEIYDATMPVNGTASLTTSKDILTAVAAGKSPEKLLIALGYAGWSAGQLEQEMALNAWLNLENIRETQAQHLIFDEPIQSRFKHAMDLMGLDLTHLSDEAGHA